MNFKDIHIGKLLKKRIDELNLSDERMLNFLKCDQEALEKMLESKSIDTEILLRWSKLLNYDYFRIYSQHLQLFASSNYLSLENSNNDKTSLPKFKKSLYTKEIIDFVLEEINSKSKTTAQIIEQYRIPKTTLYKWINKYKNL
jgi:hypothetical protein